MNVRNNRCPLSHWIGEQYSQCIPTILLVGKFPKAICWIHPMHSIYCFSFLNDINTNRVDKCIVQYTRFKKYVTLKKASAKQNVSNSSQSTNKNRRNKTMNNRKKQHYHLQQIKRKPWYTTTSYTSEDVASLYRTSLWVIKKLKLWRAENPASISEEIFHLHSVKSA